MSSAYLTASQRIAESIDWLARRAEEHPDSPELDAILALAEAASALLSSNEEEEDLDVLLTNICDALDDDPVEVQP